MIADAARNYRLFAKRAQRNRLPRRNRVRSAANFQTMALEQTAFASKRFKSAGQAQCFLSAHDEINNLFHLRRDHFTARGYRAARARAFEVWSDISGVAAQA